MAEEIIIEEIKKFYPEKLSYASLEYQNTKEYNRLIQCIENAKSDERWLQFKNVLRKSKYASDFLDHTFYSVVKVSFEANDGFKNEEGSYSFFFFISMLLPFYIFKCKLVQKPPIDFTQFPKEQWPTLLDQYKTVRDEYDALHPFRYNFIPPGLEDVVQEYIEAQKASFDYSLFPTDLAEKIVPCISVDNKDVGQATFFDCLFTGNFNNK
jgi:hypothetical protein